MSTVFRQTTMKSLLLIVLSLGLDASAFAYRDGEVIKLSETTNRFEVVMDQLIEDHTIATVVIDESVVLAEETVVPRHVVLKFRRGNRVALNGHALVINGAIEAGPYKIFDYGDVDFETLATNSGMAMVTGQPMVDLYYPQWWGADDIGSKDASVAFQAVINLAKSSGFSRTIKISGIFLIQNPLNVTKVKGVKFACNTGHDFAHCPEKQGD